MSAKLSCRLISCCFPALAIFAVGCQNDTSVANKPQHSEQPAPTASTQPDLNQNGNSESVSNANGQNDADPTENGDRSNVDSKSKPAENSGGRKTVGADPDGNRKNSIGKVAGDNDAAPDLNLEEPTEEPTGEKKPELPTMAEPTGKTGTDLGDTIPEIAGKGIDGEYFALSDFEGKVIMLDFWGDW